MAPVGTIFINLIRMTVIPLVASMLIASVGSLASSGALGRAGARAAVVAVVMLALTAVATVLIATPVLARIQIDQGAAMALRGPVASGARPAAGAGVRVAGDRAVVHRPRVAERREGGGRRRDAAGHRVCRAVRRGAGRRRPRSGATRCCA